ncbi:MAG: phosphoribosylformylglycinamidine synthase subunit PurQ [Acidimicrobiia bacterium]
MRTAVVVFPGTNCEQDVVYALEHLGGEAKLVWHRETDLAGFDAVVLPGGFAHGDYLRTGAIARLSPVMSEVERFAGEGLPVLGICNGFQILCEADLLPGALIANRDLSFICRQVDLEVTDADTIITRGLERGQRMRIPLNSYEGSWVDPTRSGRVVIRYLDAPNGSQDGAAAVANHRGNVVGIMPHPERGVEEVLGSSDGQMLLRSFLGAMVTS